MKWHNSLNDCNNQSHAFTLVELVVVVAMLGVLIIVSVPVFAGIQNKGGRMQCANNLRQVGAASMMYANEYSGWLPICSIGSANNYPTTINHLGNLTYTRYVYSDQSNPFSLVQTNATLSNYQNLGYLYYAHLAGNGNIFYCPDQWNGVLGANSYQPLLTSDVIGAVRSSYAFNPRIINPTSTGFNNSRRYQKTSQLEAHKLLAVDYLSNVGGANTLPTLAHTRERGWNILFTDGSAQFSQSTLAYRFVSLSFFDSSQTAQLQQDIIYNVLESDH